MNHLYCVRPERAEGSERLNYVVVNTQTLETSVMYSDMRTAQAEADIRNALAESWQTGHPIIGQPV